MRLIVGLGNPGAQHSGHRHNVGFMAAGAIARRHGFSPAREKFHSLAAEGTLAGDKALILWPQTYMNDSGRAVQAAMQFYKAEPNDLTVLYDEIDLEFGKVRVKKGGGAAGHNGIRSIDAHVGPDFWRVRIGVGHPGVKEMVHPHVLSDFAKDELPWVEALSDIIADNAGLLAKGQDSSFQNKVHLAMQAKGFGETKERDEPDKD
jgi:peptidyl-tRNA hydrolase, PTH1 family